MRCSALARKKRKQDPGALKAKDERRRKRLAKVADTFVKRYNYKLCSPLVFRLWRKWRRRLGYRSRWLSARSLSPCTRSGRTDCGAGRPPARRRRPGCSAWRTGPGTATPGTHTPAQHWMGTVVFSNVSTLLWSNENILIQHWFNITLKWKTLFNIIQN